MINIDYRRLSDKATIRIYIDEIQHIEETLKHQMYAPIHDPYRLEPRIRSPENILRIKPYEAVLKALLNAQKSGKLYYTDKKGNQLGLDIRISVEAAIVIFGICEASNSLSLLRLKGNIQLHLKENFNIHLESSKIILPNDTANR